MKLILYFKLVQKAGQTLPPAQGMNSPSPDLGVLDDHNWALQTPSATGAGAEGGGSAT